MITIHEALEALDLQAWLQNYAEILLAHKGEIRLRDCPECLSDKYKVYVNLEKRVWICFHCNWGKGNGNICELMAAVSGRRVHDVYLELLQSAPPTPAMPIWRSRLEALLEPSKPIVPDFDDLSEVELPGHQITEKSVVGGAAVKYLRSRGLSSDEIQDLTPRIAMTLRGFQGPFVVLPFFFRDRAVGWQGRRLIGEIEPKYVSCSDVANWLWPLDRKIVQRMKESQVAVLTEGVFDALGVIRAGFPGVCTFGKRLSERQQALLKRFGVKTLLFSWDLDASGEVEQFSKQLQTAFSVKVVELSNPPSSEKKVDPGEALRSEEVLKWLTTRLQDTIAVGTPRYQMWRLKRRLS